jgi:hypothetical protein
MGKRAKLVYLRYYPSIYMEGIKYFAQKIQASLNVTGLGTND